MGEGDPPAAGAIGALVHPVHPEETAVLAERLRLRPPGCRALESGGRTAGYAVGHPWVLGPPPRLASLRGGDPAAPP